MAIEIKLPELGENIETGVVGRLLVLFALLAGASCSTPPTTAPADSPSSEQPADRRVEGVIVSVDLRPMMVDGPARIQIETEAGETEVVLVPARMMSCQASGLDVLDRLRPGQVIAVLGAELGGGITPCRSENHYLRIIES